MITIAVIVTRSMCRMHSNIHAHIYTIHATYNTGIINYFER